jgi:TIR domain
MDYKHDIFISYRRERDHWTPWTRDIFKALLHSYLHEDLPRNPDDSDRIFVDERIDEGADWVNEIGLHLATSRVVVAVFSGSYFTSPWCVHELDLILERLHFYSGAGPINTRLIIPVVVHDGEHIPDPVSRIQPANLSKWWIAGLMRGTPAYQELSEAVRALSPKVAKAINTAPDFDEVYDAQVAGNEVAPTRFVLKKPRPPTAPPRLKP